MKTSSAVLFISLAFTLGNAQLKRPKPATTLPPGVPAKPSVDKGTVRGQTYTNTTFRFQITFPDTWLTREPALDLRAPASLAPASKTRMNRALEQVTVLLIALPRASGDAVATVAVEDLAANPQIKDAVDYFDAMRATFAAMRLPADFSYSATQAEKLGAQQFGYLDTSSKEGKKRMYATVRNGFAIIFTFTYKNADDLKAFRDVLANGDFGLR